MNGTVIRRSALLGALFLPLVGCAPKFTPEMKQRMEQRDPRYDRLSDFVGEWEVSGVMTMPGSEEQYPITMTSAAEWNLDKTIVVERYTAQCEQMGDYKGMHVYTYDPKADIYRMYGFGSNGQIATGTMHYDAEDSEWEVRCDARNTRLGWDYKSVGELTHKGDNRYVFEWEDWCGLMKVAEFEGTATRKGGM